MRELGDREHEHEVEEQLQIGGALLLLGALAQVPAGGDRHRRPRAAQAWASIVNGLPGMRASHSVRSSARRSGSRPDA